MSPTYELRLDKRSDSGGRPVGSLLTGRQILYFLLMMPGVFFCLMAMSIYPPLDSRLPMGVMLSLFLWPVALHVVIWVLKPVSAAAAPWKTVYACASGALVVFCLFLFLNGRLDRSPLNQITTTVIRKSVYRGRRGTSYHLAVTSWRPGKTAEHFGVREDVFDRAVVGRTATIELHPGFFGLPWHGSISPESGR